MNRHRRYLLDNPARRMWHNAKGRAAKAGVPFYITVKDIEDVWPEDNACPIFGTTLVVGKSKSGPDSPTLDRMRPEVGYVPGNLRVCSHRANAMKADADAVMLHVFALWILKTIPLPSSAQLPLPFRRSGIHPDPEDHRVA